MIMYYFVNHNDKCIYKIQVIKNHNDTHNTEIIT